MSHALPHVLLNGELLPLEEARISPLDRGFLYGDAVYEVIPCYGGRIFELPAHFDRLERSLRETGIATTLDRGLWRDGLASLVERNGGGDLGIYIQITRGQHKGRDHRFPAGIQPTSFAMCMPLTVPAETGGTAITGEDIRWHRNDIKATSLLANVLLRQQAHEAGAAEMILLRNGRAIEGSASNLFVVSDGTVLTPPLGKEILPGITRQVILRLLEELEIPHAETHIPLQQLRAADEIWLVSSLREIMPVVRLDETPVGRGEHAGKPGPVWQRVKAAFDACKRADNHADNHENRLRNES